ncbi:hypothetical protein [Persicobacter diffluens]|uniref:hypothetical protein n=1 Tax=Persicobacter diffluens TaxID=981 RepID=UPI0030C7238B
MKGNKRVANGYQTRRAVGALIRTALFLYLIGFDKSIENHSGKRNYLGLMKK